jgi:hypothetical protein
VGHEPADEMYVTAEPVQLGDGYVALELLRGWESGLELSDDGRGHRSPCRSLNLHELADQLQTFGFSELIEGLPLGLDRRSPSTTLITRRCLLATCGSKPC